MSRVVVRHCAYDYGMLRENIFEMMDAMGGGTIREDSHVVIKPNLLAPAPPEKAMLTHPLVVRAVAEYVVQRGAHPQISDSPAMGSFEKVLKESGIMSAIKGLPVTVREFRNSVPVDIGEPFNTVEIAEAALQADTLINLPKLKTHTQMLLTLGVKNLFGCIVGLRKPQWHFRAGVDREMFARLLVLIYRAVRPTMTILDGILAMEGQGPGRSGKPRHTGVLIGSTDAVAVDKTVCQMLGVPANRLLTNDIAERMGLSSGSIEIEGDLPRIKDFTFPVIAPLVFGPKVLHGLMRRHLVQRPVVNDALCKQCGECWKTCPAKAIAPGKKSLYFNYDDCIRCYCCIEVCPHGALTAEETFAGKIAGRAMRKKM